MEITKGYEMGDKCILIKFVEDYLHHKKGEIKGYHPRKAKDLLDKGIAVMADIIAKVKIAERAESTKPKVAEVQTLEPAAEDVSTDKPKRGRPPKKDD